MAIIASSGSFSSSVQTSLNLNNSTLSQANSNHDGNSVRLNNKAFESSVDHPLADKCLSYIVNTFEHVWSRVTWRVFHKGTE